jgi:hypothetical protein
MRLCAPLERDAGGGVDQAVGRRRGRRLKARIRTRRALGQNGGDEQRIDEGQGRRATAEITRARVAGAAGAGAQTALGHEVAGAREQAELEQVAARQSRAKKLLTIAQRGPLPLGPGVLESMHAMSSPGERAYDPHCRVTERAAALPGERARRSSAPRDGAQEPVMGSERTPDPLADAMRSVAVMRRWASSAAPALVIRASSHRSSPSLNRC